MRNKLYFGDNLEVMREMKPNLVDLICTDPPFNSGRDYNIFLDSEAQKKAFVDIWRWDTVAEESREDIRVRAEDDLKYGTSYGLINQALIGCDYLLQNRITGWRGSMRAYLAFMGPRIVEMHKILKETGSFYLHCDPAASHYLKIILDAIFDQKNNNDNDNFLNEIIWTYAVKGKPPKYGYPRKHDTILFYRKSNKSTLNRLYQDITQEDLEKRFPKIDENGRRYKLYTKAHGKRKYADEYAGIPLPDYWIDIPSFGTATQSKERTGYPTQKPRKLYERMIQASSNKGDLVLDPFAGCGTTIDAAQSKRRSWMGIDLTLLALEPMKHRMYDRYKLRSCIDYDLNGYPTNMQEVELLVKNEKRYHDFSNWAVTRLGLRPTKNSGDGGFDGIADIGVWTPEKMEHSDKIVMAEVKSGKPTLSDVRSFCEAINTNKAIAGVFITLEKVSAGMKEEANKMGCFKHNDKEYKRLQFWQITEEYFDNPDIINKLVKLPDTIKISRKMDPHIEDNQANLLEII